MPKSKARKRGKVKQHKVKNLYDRVFDHEEEVMASVYNLSLPFDSDLAEHDARIVELKRKYLWLLLLGIYLAFEAIFQRSENRVQRLLGSLTDSFQGCAFDHPTALSG